MKKLIREKKTMVFKTGEIEPGDVFNMYIATKSSDIEDLNFNVLITDVDEELIHCVTSLDDSLLSSLSKLFNTISYSSEVTVIDLKLYINDVMNNPEITSITMNPLTLAATVDSLAYYK